MRNVPRIWEAWSGSGDGSTSQSAGSFIGELKPSTRVTVEKAYWLNTEITNIIGKWKRGPARWWQRADTSFSTPTEYTVPIDSTGLETRREVSSSQVETEIPNILTVTKSKSFDSDVGTCDIVIANILSPRYGEPEGEDGELGTMGYYTPTHGTTQEARARWGHVPNEWQGVLAENALLRVYEGFGGQELSITEALTEEYIVLKGVFLVDAVSVSTDGTLHLRCRDMAKLFVDQQLFHPLVPGNLYPLKYCRYTLQGFEIPPNPPPPPPGGMLLTQQTGYLDSSNEDYYGGEQGPHPGTDAVDWSFNDPPGPPGSIRHQRTYWLSEPKATPNDQVWIELDAGNMPVNCVYLHAWAGNQRVMISVFENGQWVEPEAARIGGHVSDADGALPYVCDANVAWEGQPPGPMIYLPRVYRAEKIRYTFTKLAWANELGGGYRAGARKIVHHLDMGAVHSTSLVFSGASIPFNPDQRAGYWQVRSTGQMWAFGDARTYPSHEPLVHIWPIIGFEAHPDGLGYWTLDFSGVVRSYGSAVHHGHDHALGRFDVVDMACTPTGDGYWILHKDGMVTSHGDATDHGDGSYVGFMANGGSAVARSIESHPSTSGYWILYTNGEVEAHNLTDHGSASEAGFSTNEYMASIRRTTDGAGYWVTSGGGRVQHFGNAQDLGDAPAYPEEKWALGLCWDLLPYSLGNDGYAIQHADGNLDFFGTFEQFGSIGQGGGQLRSDGDYKDYADIFRDLALWSGYLLKYFGVPLTKPEVFGNIESTGAFAKECLPEEMFDKHPVIDAMRQIREIVGYVQWIDDEGGVRFQSPNWWSMGNYLIDGTPYDYMPEIDEKVNCTDYQVHTSDTNDRSEIIIASADPTQNYKDTLVTRVIPPGASKLKGLCKPAMWTNGVFTDPKEQRVMADLIAMHIWFASRQGEITCIGNPLIDIDDQVRIYERQTGETHIHYVRGISTTHDLVSGEYSMTLTTNWLGGSPYGQTPLFYACAPRPQGDGYWQANAAGSVYSFGAAQIYPKNEADSHTERVVGLRSSLSGDGYYTVDINGKVMTYGDAEHYGQLHRAAKDVVDMALTPTGEGYWLLCADGTVFSFGDALALGDAEVDGELPTGDDVTACSIESHPVDHGYWVLLTDGDIQPFGVDDHGDADLVGYGTRERNVRVRATPTGDGLWVVSNLGMVTALAGAVHDGDGSEDEDDNPTLHEVWDLMANLSPGHDGYALQHASGRLDVMGDFAFLGSIGGEGQAGPDSVGWAIVSEEALRLSPDPDNVIGVSEDVRKFLERTGSKSAANAVLTNFQAKVPVTTKGAP